MRAKLGTWHYIIPLLTLGAGTLFAASANTARGTDLRGGDTKKITELIADAQRQTRHDRADYQRLRSQVDALSRRAGRRDARVRQAGARADAIAGRAGFTPLSGGGVRVTLDDAPRRSELDRRRLGASADDLVVHQQDVQAVVNALWAGGARGLQIMDQRLVSTSAVRCVGNTLILQGVVYSPPFRITAVGDPARLRAALDAAPEIKIYQQYVAEFGLGYAVKTLDKVTLPAFTGNVSMTYATGPEELSGADHHP
ncbi:MAG TPA: DUF881 domain-containing protein [Streptosporangiaceae bacterium]|nr:DUF881 domain-containing protein [Streptosporangiaceae bacterium]